jgi:hypothetical protein
MGEYAVEKRISVSNEAQLQIQGEEKEGRVSRP